MDSEASSFDGQPKLLLHAQGVVPAKVQPCGAVDISDCRDAVTEGDLVAGASNFYFVYLLAAIDGLNGIESLLTGISYQENQPGNVMDGVGIDIFDFYPCSNYALGGAPNLPEPLGWSIFVWEDVCETDVLAPVGYFYMGAYSSDVLQLIERPIDNQAALYTCDPGAHQVYIEESSLGSVSFSSGATVTGCNPCDGPCPNSIAVEPATWSGIKSLVR
jgi:hypothetical protein